MAVPKRRTSKSKRNKRRSHDAIGTPARITCPQCWDLNAPHRVCSNCGTYRGREVIRTEEE